MKTQSEEEQWDQGSGVLDTVHGWQEDLRATAEKATHATTRFVEENPWKAIGLVAVCALALGFLLRTGSD